MRAYVLSTRILSMAILIFLGFSYGAAFLLWTFWVSRTFSFFSETILLCLLN